MGSSSASIFLAVATSLLITGIVAGVRWAIAINRRITALTWVMWSWVHRQDPKYAEAVSTVLFSDAPDLSGGNSDA